METLYLDLLFNTCDILLILQTNNYKNLINTNLELIFSIFSSRQHFQNNDYIGGRFFLLKAKYESLNISNTNEVI